MELPVIDWTKIGINKSFGELVQLARKGMGWSQAKLADELKISQVSVHRIESGEQPVTLMRAIEISDLMGIPFESIKRSAENERLDTVLEAQPEKIQAYIRKLLIENPS